MRFILERVAQQLDQAARAERIASTLASTHEDARQAPYSWRALRVRIGASKTPMEEVVEVGGLNQLALSRAV